MRGEEDAPLLPPVLPRWPATLLAGDVERNAATEINAALLRVRAETLWWPAVRARASAPRALAFGAEGERRALEAFPETEVVLDPDPADVDPERLEALFDPPPRIALWAALGGLGEDSVARAALLAARGVSPWTGAPLSLEEALEAQALLRSAAMRARGPIRAPGLSPWKRRCLRPFLTGPDGPPRYDAGASDGRLAVWGASEAPEGALRIEDGFLRSVGLGLKHAPPLSLAIHSGRLYFDATGVNSFENAVAGVDFTPGLRARAAALRKRVVALRLTKYNLPDAGALPDPEGREAVLVAGQVEDDASIRLGAGKTRTNRALLIAARARFPDAFLLYKPHPDVLTGRRPGAVGDARDFANAVTEGASAVSCLDWADRVASITSLMGFEALLRGKAASCFGRPFYSGWGLTDDVDPPPRARRLDLDELTAAALILYPSYMDPETRLPAPPEIAMEALARDASAWGAPGVRLRRSWRRVASWCLARF